MDMLAPNANLNDGDNMAPVETVAHITCDVFLSHRGPDTKKNFVDYLLASFKRVGITCFVDEFSLDPGTPNTAWDVIIAHARSARIKVPVLSLNYGESCYCLEELRVITANPTNIIIPIFFDETDKLQARIQESIHSACQRGGTLYVQKESAYHKAVEQVFERTAIRLDQVNGYTGSRLTEAVVKAVLDTLDRPVLEIAKYPVDMDLRVGAVLNKLRAAESKVVMLGLYGMGGVGKTTLAKAIYNRLYSEFAGSGCCFVEVGPKEQNATHSENARLVQLQLLMLKQLTGSKEFKNDTNSIDEGTTKLQNHLRDMKVLLVVDDIWSDDQREALLDPFKLGASSPVLGTGSVVLVTSRDLSLVGGHEQHSLVEEVAGLDDQPAKKLFCQSAFSSDQVPGELERIVEEIIYACQGLPLALDVVGRFLGKRRMKGVQFWEETLHQLRNAEALTGTADDRLWQKLELSYKDLAPDYQQLFLDICCFALGKHKDNMLAAWGQGTSLKVDLLVERSLIRLVPSTDDEWRDCMVFSVHDQLRDMGRMIANRTPFEHILTTAANSIPQKDYEFVETMSCAGGTWREISFGMPFMPRLRFLDLGTTDWDGTFPKGVPKQLVYLEWEGPRRSALSTLLAGVAACTKLVLLKCHKIDPPVQRLGTLWGAEVTSERLNPSGNVDAGSLLRLESVGKLAALKRLDLSYCYSLVALPESFGKLTTLQVLDLRGCRLLKALPKSFGKLAALQTLDLAGDMYGSHLRALPESFGKLTALQMLRLWKCHKLVALPESFGELAALQTLDLSWCSSLVALPKSFCALTDLQTLDMRQCGSLIALPESFGALAALQMLNLSGCSSLAALPESFGELAALQILDLSWSQSSLRHDPNHLAVDFWKLDRGLSRRRKCRLQQRHRSLAALPESFGKLANLKALDLSGCGRLAALPESFGKLVDLRELGLSRCRSLVALPESFGKLVALQRLNLSRCHSLASLPESFGELAQLQRLDLSRCRSLVALPESFGKLTALQQLHLTGCPCLALPKSVSEWDAVVYAQQQQHDKLLLEAKEEEEEEEEEAEEEEEEKEQEQEQEEQEEEFTWMQISLLVFLSAYCIYRQITPGPVRITMKVIIIIIIIKMMMMMIMGLYATIRINLRFLWHV